MYLPELICYFNGEFIKESEVKITSLDHILRGFGVFDVSRTFNHVPFFWEEHIKRLFNSLRYCHIDPHMTEEEMYNIQLELLKRNEENLKPADDFAVVPLISGGRKEFYMGPTSPDPTILINCAHLSPRYPSITKRYREGVHLVLASTRQYSPDALSSQVKHCSRLNLYLADWEVHQVDPEAWSVLLDSRGFVAEGNGHNVLWVKDGILFLATSHSVLPGISQGVILKLAGELGIEVIRGNYTPWDLYSADEIFCTGTTPGIFPVNKFNEREMPKPVWGPVTKRLFDAYCELVGVDLIERAKQSITYEKTAVK